MCFADKSNNSKIVNALKQLLKHATLLTERRTPLTESSHSKVHVPRP